MLASHGRMMIMSPLMGVASADDAWFERFFEKEIIGPNFMRPQDWLSGARSLAVLFLPFTKEVRIPNREPGFFGRVGFSQDRRRSFQRKPFEPF